MAGSFLVSRAKSLIDFPLGVWSLCFLLSLRVCAFLCVFLWVSLGAFACLCLRGHPQSPPGPSQIGSVPLLLGLIAGHVCFSNCFCLTEANFNLAVYQIWVFACCCPRLVLPFLSHSGLTPGGANFRLPKLDPQGTGKLNTDIRVGLVTILTLSGLPKRVVLIEGSPDIYTPVSFFHMALVRNHDLSETPPSRSTPIKRNG